VEGSAEYRRSLAELHQLASCFQRGLDEAQRQRWLLLEEALLVHSERLSHAYHHAGFRSGVEWSARSTSSRGEDVTSALRVEAEAAVIAGADCLAALARLLLAVAKRRERGPV
jgi:hypothetical protein